MFFSLRFFFSGGESCTNSNFPPVRKSPVVLLVGANRNPCRALCIFPSGKKAESSESAAVDLDEWAKYCEDTSATKRRPSRTVWAGKVPIGSEHRIALQTMTTTNTNDVDATVAQARIWVQCYQCDEQI